MQWVVIPLLWLAILPAFGFIITSINKRFAQQGVYLKADAHTGTLELTWIDVALRREQIVAIVRVKRWFDTGDGHKSGLFINVLAHDGRGGYDYYPLFRDTPMLWGNQNAAERLATFLRVPLRQVTRTWRESRATIAEEAG